MKASIYYVTLGLLFIITSCSTTKPFVKENVCSPNAVNYMNKSKGRSFVTPKTPALAKKLAETQTDMQQCYQDYMARTGHKEFQTCMVVGVDSKGRMEYYNFSAQDTNSDRAFLQCAVKVTKKIPFQTYGKNYILLQSYNFYH